MGATVQRFEKGKLVEYRVQDFGRGRRRRSGGPRVKRVEHESADQTAVIVWAKGEDGKSGMSWKYPGLRMLYAIPNGRGTHFVTRAKMKREGALSGMPDLCLPMARGPWHSLYIEMKHGNVKIEPHQMEIHKTLRAMGNYVAVCWSPEDAQRCLTAYVAGGPMSQTPTEANF